MKKIILVDGNSIMYRAYYATAAMGKLMENSKGLFTNAIYAFANMMNTLLKKDFDNILVAFDAGKQTFRHSILTDYKDGRKAMPDEMRVQIPYLKELLDIMGVKRYELSLYEADDIIGTISKQAKDQGYIVNIYSSDKDLLQLVDENCFVNLCKKGIADVETFDKQAIFDKYGLTNKQMIDLKALMGDPSDNLKGIPGVGEKTAVSLLTKYGNLESIIDNKDSIKGALGKKICEHYNEALVCQKMVTINQESPLEISLDDTVYNGFDEEKLRDFYIGLEFHSLAKKLKAQEQALDYKIMNDYSNLNSYLIEDSSLYLELDGSNYHKANIIGLGVCNSLGNFFFPLDVITNSKELKLFLESDNKKNIFGLKKTIVALNRYGIKLRGVDFDCLLASYILNQDLGKEDIIIIAQMFDYSNLTYDDAIYGHGSKFILPEVSVYAPHIVKKALAVKNLKNLISNKLKENNQIDLLLKIEMPLAIVLANVEMQGMKVSLEELDLQKKNLTRKIMDLEDQIFDLAGYQFNISSTKQLAELLFEKLDLPSSKKTKTGYSTDSQVLEGLVGLHPIVSMILEYRTITKLFSTYIEGLASCVYSDGLVHTIFQQALTQTGRLSSIEPNLQNIPVRTKLGKEIRKIFVPKNDILLSLDYSQIELRVLAHMANVTKLIEAFNNGEDIHTQTAKLVFKVDEVSSDLRRKAKAINFGIIYGISSWGLSSDVNVSVKEAADFISKYLETYPEIKIYMDNIKEFASQNGYVLTMLNRRRYIADINSKNYNVSQFAMRTAMNAPIQGSAADILKVAMIDIYSEMEKLGLKSKMISQVHDELIFDCVLEEKDIVLKIAIDKMSNAVALNVPLVVDYGFGNNWFEVK